MEEISIRTATLEDKPALIEFEQQVIEEERPHNAQIRLADVNYYDLDNLFVCPRSQLLVAEANGTVVGSGYAQIRTSKKTLSHAYHSYLGFMYVVPAYRGRGINKKIIERLIQWSKDQGVSDSYLDVYSANEAAKKAYEKSGFVNSMNEMKLNFG